MASKVKTPNKKSNSSLWLRIGLVIMAIVAILAQYKFLSNGTGWIFLEAAIGLLIWVTVDLRKWIHYDKENDPKYFLKKETFPLKRFIAMVIFGILAAFIFWGWIAAVVFALLASFGVIWLYPTPTEKLEKVLGLSLIFFLLAVGINHFIGLWGTAIVYLLIATGLASWKFRWHPRLQWLPWKDSSRVNAEKAAERQRNHDRLLEAITDIRTGKETAWESFGKLCAELNLEEEDVTPEMKEMISGQENPDEVIAKIIGLSIETEAIPSRRPRDLAIDWVLSNVHPSVRWSAGFFLGFAVLAELTRKFGIGEWFGAATITAGIALVISVVWWQIDLRAKLAPYFRRQPRQPKSTEEPTVETPATDDEDQSLLDWFKSLGAPRPNRREAITIAVGLIVLVVMVALGLGMIFTGIFAAGHKIDTLATQNAAQNSGQNNALSTLVARPSSTPQPTATPAFTATPQPTFDASGINAALGVDNQRLKNLENAPTVTPMATATPMATSTPQPTATPQPTTDLSALQTQISGLQTAVATLSTPAPTKAPTPTANP